MQLCLKCRQPFRKFEKLFYSSNITISQFDKLSENTINKIADAVESLATKISRLSNLDCSYEANTLTISVELNKIYVINKQMPLKQIWLSSPISGPKHYDYTDSCWKNAKDSKLLSELLCEEFKLITGENVREFENIN